MTEKKQYNLEKMSLNQKIMFFEQFSMYLSSSIPVTTALMDMQKYAPSAKIKLIAHLLLKEIDRGVNFSDAILKCKKGLGSTYCSLMSLGAQAGELPRILNDIWESLKQQKDFIRSIIGQCIYPAFLFFFLMVPAVGLLFFFILPRLQKIWEVIGTPPAIFSTALGFSALFKHFFIPTLIIAIVLFMALLSLFKKLIKSEAGTKLPFLDKLVKNYNLSMFTKILAISYSAGIPITHGLILASETIPNRYMQKELYKTSAMVDKKPLSECFATTNFFDRRMLAKIKTGEQTGELDKMLVEISQTIEQNFKLIINSMIKLIEPILMVIMAVIIGFYGMVIMGSI